MHFSCGAFTQNAFGVISRLQMSFSPDRYIYPAYPVQPVAYHPLSKFWAQPEAQHCPARGPWLCLYVVGRALSPKLISWLYLYAIRVKILSFLHQGPCYHQELRGRCFPNWINIQSCKGGYGEVVDYRKSLEASFPTLQVSIGRLKCSVVVFSRIQHFLSFIVSNIVMLLIGLLVY